MMNQDTKIYIRNRALPKALDIEVAKRAILEHIFALSNSQTGELISGSQLASYISQQRGLFPSADPVEPGNERLEDQINQVKAEIAVREAIQSLQDDGVLVAYGQLVTSSGSYADSIEKRLVRIPEFNRSDTTYDVQIPSIHIAYRLAAKFREDQNYLLASDAIYIASLDQGNLSSRAKRCLRESIRAYQVGLYLSATMAVGAASESLWMQLSRVICAKKPNASTQLDKLIGTFSPSIAKVISEAWQVLVTQYGDILDKIISKNERKTFKDHADRLCELRNYAMHKDEANEDEPLFSYSVTGLLLIESIRYFKQLARLVEIIDATP